MGVARVSNEEATKAKEEEASKEIKATGAEVSGIAHGNHLVKIAHERKFRLAEDVKHSAAWEATQGVFVFSFVSCLVRLVCECPILRRERC